MLKGITSLFFIVGVSLHLVGAELPPLVYADRKKFAQEKLVLHVDNATTTSETEIDTLHVLSCFASLAFTLHSQFDSHIKRVHV